MTSAGEETRIPPSRPVKRSFSIAGHRTSISLESAFWEALREIAAAEGRPLAQLVAEIDRDRGDAGLSGAVRVWVLDYFRSGGPAAAQSDAISNPCDVTQKIKR